MKFIRGKCPEICFNFGNYNIDDLKKYELITKSEYISEKLKRCSAAEFEAYFDKWSIEGHETLIRNVLECSVASWTWNGNIDKINLICHTPKFVDLIDGDGWENMLASFHRTDRIMPLPIDLICLIITKLVNCSITISLRFHVNVNLLYAIYMVFKCGYGGEIMREKLLNFVSDIDPDTVVVNFGDGARYSIAAIALGIMERNHNCEVYETFIRNNNNHNGSNAFFQYNLAMIVAKARMPKDVSGDSQIRGEIINFFISLIDPQFDNL